MAIDLHTSQQLARLLEKPAMVTEADAPMLKELVKTYPYYQPLHLLLARAKANAVHDNHFAAAALHNGGLLLHRIVHQPETLEPQAVNLVKKKIANLSDNHNQVLTQSAETIDQADEQEIFEEISEIGDGSLPLEHQVLAGSDGFSNSVDIAEDEDIFEEISEVSNASFAVGHQSNDNSQEEVYDEISEVNTNTFEIQERADLLPDEMAIESIVATDFFAFEKSFNKEASTDGSNNVALVTQPEEYNQEAEEQIVSKYNDDKLPYTFLWWLAKTRKEHEQIFQPYVTPKKNSESAGELQQQYVEHIFHLQTPFNINEEADKVVSNKQVAHRGDEIIEQFIKNEPQIKAPKAEQINNENKAKKSAEDHYDLVSETLAAIYIEQMLYHKAIDTYQKLSLKFPEKSRYFADLIQSLEKKI